MKKGSGRRECNATHNGGKVILKTGVSGDNKVALEFIDNGRGIEKDNLNKIFDPLYTTKKSGEGMGLGLSVSRHSGMRNSIEQSTAKN